MTPNLRRHQSLVAREFERAGLTTEAFEVRLATTRAELRNAVDAPSRYLGGVYAWAHKTGTTDQAKREYGAASQALTDLRLAIVESFREDERAQRQRAVTLPPPVEAAIDAPILDHGRDLREECHR